MLQEFVQEVENMTRGIINELHTALPAKIVKIDYKKGTVAAKPVGNFVTEDNTALEYPLIDDIPIVMPISNDIGIAYPVMVGDSCLIIVSEIELDEWRTGSKSDGTLKFELSNAIAIPGLLKKPSKLLTKASSNRSVVISASDNTEISVSKDTVNIKSPKVTVNVGSTNMTLQGSTATLNGNINVNGNITYSGTLSGENPWK